MTSPNITLVNEENFEKEVLQSDKLVLIDFYADWCGPCKALAPTLDQFADENAGKVKVVKINVDQSGALAQAFQVRGIPTLVTMKDGQALIGMTGNHPKSNIEKMVEAALQLAAENNINKNKGPKGPQP